MIGNTNVLKRLKKKNSIYTYKDIFYRDSGVKGSQD